MAKPTAQSYTIRTIADLIRIIDSNNAQALSEDLATWVLAVALQKAVMEDAGAGRLDCERSGSLVWTNDGVNSTTCHAHNAAGENIGTFTVAAKPSDPAPTE